jgi:Domain of unknown function (DUF4326)
MDDMNAEPNYSEIFAAYGSSIPYLSGFSQMTGKPTSAILLQQINFYWVGKKRQPFYKFKEPCPEHALYEEGDSWIETLAFSRSEFDGALDNIATKIVKGDSRNAHYAYKLPNPHDFGNDAIAYGSALVNAVKQIVLYWTDSNHVTWYEINRPVFNQICEIAFDPKVKFLLYLDIAKNRLYLDNVEKLLYLYTENTIEDQNNSFSAFAESDAPIAIRCRVGNAQWKITDEAHQIYCGRDFKGFKDRGFGNPYRLSKKPTLAEIEDSVAKYRSYARTNTDLLRKVMQLKAIATPQQPLQLGCFCAADKPCHCDALLTLINLPADELQFLIDQSEVIILEDEALNANHRLSSSSLSMDDQSGGEEPTLFGSDTPPVAYVPHECPKCGSARSKLSVPTGDKPPKPVGEVVRRTSWVCYACEHCREMEISGKEVYVGDGDYDLIRGFTPVFMDWNEWTLENYYQNGPALTARYNELVTAAEPAKSAIVSPFKASRPIDTYLNKPLTGKVGKMRPSLSDEPATPAERHFLTEKTQPHVLAVCTWLEGVRDFVPQTFELGAGLAKYSKGKLSTIALDTIKGGAELYKAWLTSLPSVPIQKWDIAMVQTVIPLSIDLYLSGVTLTEVTRFSKSLAEQPFWASKLVSFDYVCKNIGAWKAQPQTAQTANPEMVEHPAKPGSGVMVSPAKAKQIRQQLADEQTERGNHGR